MLEIQTPARSHIRVFEALEQLEFRRITAIDDLEDVFRLRYRGYRAGGHMDELPSKRCTDRFDEMSNCHLFGVYRDTDLLATIRIHVIDRYDATSPSACVYPEIVGALRLTAPAIVDSTRFVIDPDIGWMGLPVHLVTTRISVLACEYFEARYSLSLVRPSHGAFYRRYFGFRCFGENRQFAGLNFPVDLLVSDVEAVRDTVKQKLPFTRSLPIERKLLFDTAYANKACLVTRSTAHLANKAHALVGFQEKATRQPPAMSGLAPQSTAAA